MATNNQSQLQSFLETGIGLNANAQNAQPTNPNNGNPNQVYNIPAQSDQQGNWWIPQSGSGVNWSNSSVDNILNNLLKPAPTGTGTGTPPGGVTPPGGTTPPPGTQVPPPTNSIAQPGGTGPISVGPISGPVQRRPWDLRENYNNAMPNTGAGVGREGALPWAAPYQGTPWGAGSNAPGNNQLMDVLKGLGTQLKEEVRGEWNNFIQNITLQNGIGGVAEVVGSALGIPSVLIRQLFPQDTSTAQMNPEQLAATNQKLAQQLQGLIGGVLQESGDRASTNLENLMKSGGLPAGWTNDTMSAREWQKYQDRFNFANLFTGAGTGSRNAITGLPSSSASGDFMNQLTAEAMAKYLEMVKRKGEQQK